MKFIYKNLKIVIISICGLFMYLSANTFYANPAGAGLGVCANSLAEGQTAIGYSSAAVATDKREAGVFFTSYLGGTMAVNSAFLLPLDLGEDLNLTIGLNLLYAFSSGLDTRDITGAVVDPAERYSSFSAFIFSSLQVKRFKFGLDINNPLPTKNRLFYTSRNFSLGVSGIYTHPIQMSEIRIGVAGNNILAPADNQLAPLHISDSVSLVKKVSRKKSLGLGVGHTFYRDYNLVGVSGMFMGQAGVGSTARFDLNVYLSYQYPIGSDFTNPGLAALKGGIELGIRIVEVVYGLQNSGEAGLVNKVGIVVSF